LALTGDQTAAANWTGPCLLAGLGGIAAYLVTGRPAALQVALAGFAMLAPVIIIFQARPGRERRLLGIIALGLAALGALTAAVAMVGPAVLAELAFAAGWLGFVLYPMVVRLVRGS
jgi:hypothetical protein